jgi:energy-coupling factor transporter ATP-binding protein EcfA2/DNA-binding winged helix-turn-helix (wHTH) protein
MSPYTEHSFFEHLQAEREFTWLGKAFVRPDTFLTMTGMRSLVILGESGSGKSTLLIILAQYTEADSQRRLVVEWQPELPQSMVTGSAAIHTYLGQILDSCTRALLSTFCHEAELFYQSPAWVRSTIHWFIATYITTLSGSRELLISRLTENATPQGGALVRELLMHPVEPIFHTNQPDPRMLAALSDAIQRLGFGGLWIMVDGLERLIDVDPIVTTSTIHALLSTLNVFEDPHVSFKIAAPLEIDSAIMSSTGVARRRLDVYRLRWSQSQLVQMIEQRVALLTRQSEFRLADLYPEEETLKWLDRFGGSLPRGWLETIKPFVAAYQQIGATRRLTKNEWTRIAMKQPPRLRIDPDTKRVSLGYGELVEIQPGAEKLLHYLYDNRHRLCSRSELYYRALLGLSYEPQSSTDHSYAAPDEWEGMLNTNLYRLRQSIEVDPAHPIYIITRRGKGITLDNAD